jgi:hypothetical protein
MSFISSGNRSTPTVWPLGSLKPEVGATPTEAIGLNFRLSRYIFTLINQSFTCPNQKPQTNSAIELYFEQHQTMHLYPSTIIHRQCIIMLNKKKQNEA